MQTKFKRGQKVKLLVNPDPEYIEYHEEVSDNPSEIKEIKKGSIGEINIILPNGQYHVEFHDKDGNAIAYVPMAEESLEAAE
ncbi:hypothetical protein CMI45_02895 [Candidatus Pacearchaeota archaeon]|nr:hypothetical protein [Candidatus Pacearchaeota archaeon]|tara:strand:+ start:434 stop:679 length:246 start_codon:yes stop_codon:yes gene_type:complete